MVKKARAASRRKASTSRREVVVLPSQTGARRKVGRGNQTIVVQAGPEPLVTGHGRRQPGHVPAPKNMGNRYIAEAPLHLARLAWRYRWQLAPVAGTGLVWLLLIGRSLYVEPLLAVLFVVSGWWGWSADRWSRERKVIAGRKFLSSRELLIIAEWAVGQLIASMIILAFSPTLAWSAGLLAGAAGWPSYSWWVSRTAVPTRKLSPQSRERLKLWERVSTYGIDIWKGSHVLAGTASEPTPGTLVFCVQLAPDKHAENAEGEEPRKSVESLLGLPPDCVRAKRDKGNSTRVWVTMSPGRHLALNTVSCQMPPVMVKNMINLAVTPSGQDVSIPRQNAKGIMHGRITGNTDNGKTSTARHILTAKSWSGMQERGRSDEVIWLVDGKRGTSLPEIKPVFDWYGTRDWQWPLIIEAMYAVMLDRQLRRGDADLSMWRGSEIEIDPIITLWVEESSAVVKSLKEHLGPMHKRIQAHALEILQHGRALGLCLWQSTQDPIGDNWLGGREARELMAKGAVIAHRPGGTTGAQYGKDGASEKLRLLRLPPEPGFAGIMVNGQVVADVARVRYAEESACIAWAKTVTPRSLEGADLIAAGDAYAERFQIETSQDQSHLSQNPISPAASAPARVEARVPMGRDGTGLILPAGLANDLNDITAWLLKVITIHPGITTDEIIERGAGTRGRSRTNVYRVLAQLRDAGRLAQNDSNGWKIEDGGSRS